MACYRGELTADWRAGDRGQFAIGNGSPDLPIGWRWTKLGELAQIKSGVTLGKRRIAGDRLVQVPYLRVANVQRGALNLAMIKQVAVTPAEAEALYLRAGDIRPISSGLVQEYSMPAKPIELPPDVAKAFAKDMRAFHLEPNAIKRDEIAARQTWLINQHLKPNNKELRTNEVKDMFERMRDLL